MAGPCYLEMIARRVADKISITGTRSVRGKYDGKLVLQLLKFHNIDIAVLWELIGKLDVIIRYPSNGYLPGWNTIGSPLVATVS